jgi:hypothetical protein
MLCTDTVSLGETPVIFRTPFKEALSRLAPVPPLEVPRCASDVRFPLMSLYTAAYAVSVCRTFLGVEFAVRPNPLPTKYPDETVRLP